MSSVKWTIANSEDRYWEMREKYERLIDALKKQDTDFVVEAIKEWDEFEEREEKIG